jgi:hypothetical protein
MRTSLEIPDDIYREMKIRAASEGTTMREIILDGVAMRLNQGSQAVKQEQRPRFPAVRSRNPGSLKLGEEGVYEYIPFP